VTVAQLTAPTAPAIDSGRRALAAGRRSREPQQTFQLLLAIVWLLDAVLQLQPFFFTAGASGFYGMLNGLAAGNPSWIQHTITWNASIVNHQPILTNALFASIQFLIGFGIVWKRTCKPALALSIVWALGVWWFGEGAGGIFHGAATPFGGGPGAVLLYAVLAVLLWPREGQPKPFVAAQSVGLNAAKAIWVVVWGLLGVLSLVGSGRSPQALQGIVTTLDNGQPGWVARIDKWSGAFLLHHGTPAAITLAVICLVVAIGVFLPPRITRVTIVLGMVTFAVIWVAVENFGGILAGGATDPNSGPLVILIALAYWPLSVLQSSAGAAGGEADPTVVTEEV
jgi:hypothetical protein